MFGELSEGAFNGIIGLIFVLVMTGLFGGLEFLIGGDGLISRAINTHKLSGWEKSDLEFMRSFRVFRFTPDSNLRRFCRIVEASQEGSRSYKKMVKARYKIVMRQNEGQLDRLSNFISQRL
jgi:hypothetical protein